MIVIHFVRFFSISFCAILLLSSCKDEDIASGEPSTISFHHNDGYSSENDGLIKIPIQMDKPQNAETLVHFTISGNAVQADANVEKTDFELLTESPFAIKKGESYAYIEVKILEDSHFEQELENFSIRLDRIVSGNATLHPNLQMLHYSHEIIENDYKLFLEWDAPELVDLNMFIELPNKELISANNDSGFEEVTITNVVEQEQYFVDIWNDGNHPQVSFHLKSLSAGEKEKKTILSGSFSADKNGKNVSEEDENFFLNYLMIKEGQSLKILN